MTPTNDFDNPAHDLQYADRHCQNCGITIEYGRLHVADGAVVGFCPKCDRLQCCIAESVGQQLGIPSGDSFPSESKLEMWFNKLSKLKKENKDERIRRIKRNPTTGLRDRKGLDSPRGRRR